MKILFPFVGDTVGGSHVATCILIKELLDQSNHQPVVVLHENGILENYLRQNNISYSIITDSPAIKEVRFFKLLFQMFTTIAPLGSFLKSNDIDLVHTNDLRMHYTWLLPSFFGNSIRHIWHQHSQTSSWRLAVFSFFTNTVLTISEYCKLSFPYFFKRKAKVIYNPFKSKEYNSPPVKTIGERLHLSDRDKIIGFVGNLTSQKRPDFFIKVAEEFLRKYKDYHFCYFVLIGEERDPLYTRLKHELQLSPAKDYIHFLGACFPIEPYIQEMDILIAPATNEGLGRTVIESMLCDTPVIASNHGGHKEIIEHGKTGFLVNPSSHDEFVDLLIHLLDNDSYRSKISKKAYLKAQERFSINLYLKQIETAYEG